MTTQVTPKTSLAAMLGGKTLPAKEAAVVHVPATPEGLQATSRPTDREIYQEIRTFGTSASGASQLSTGETVGDFLLKRWQESDRKRKSRAQKKRKHPGAPRE